MWTGTVRKGSVEGWELRLSLAEAEDIAGQQEEDEDFPETRQTEAQKHKEQSPPLLGKPNV